ncbi:MAG: FAD-binding protein [Rhodospirillales bacterium]|jgi:fumarate reductase (CoM/CoB) subunit A|nr:FAD-binding protein [Rhodospirillales bacterium]
MIDATIDADVLVVGGGGGGLRAAIEAHAAGARVLVLSKGIVGKSGLTQTAVTGFQVAFGCADPRDNPSVHYADTMRGSYGLANPELVDIFTREGAATVEDIESFGARFDRDDDGNFIQRRLDSSQTYPRSIKKGDSLGTPIMQALRRQMNKCDIPRRHEILVTKLLKDGNRISGAVALDFQTGELLEIRARSVIMATGGGGELFPVNSNTPDSTGDGCALALGAGADLVDMEFILMLGHAVMFPETVRGVLFTFQYLLDKGARALFNAEGEPFLSRYDPEGSDNPPRHIYARAIHGEVRAGRGSPHGGVFFDPGSVPLETVVDALPSQTQFLQSFGVDMRQPIEVGVAAHYFCGGIRIGPDSLSTVPGLYGVGECSGGPHGAARVGGNSLTEVLVFGKRAGRHAAETAATANAPTNDPDEVETECRRLLGFLEGSRNGPRPSEIKKRIKQTMNDHVGVVRDAAGLKEALDAFEEIAMRNLPAMALASPERIANYDWIQAIEATSMTRVGEAVARAALMRTESRGAHYREDHPDQIDDEWLQNIVVRQRGKELSVSSVPVNSATYGEETG